MARQELIRRSTRGIGESLTSEKILHTSRRTFLNQRIRTLYI